MPALRSHVKGGSGFVNTFTSRRCREACVRRRSVCGNDVSATGVRTSKIRQRETRNHTQLFPQTRHTPGTRNLIIRTMRGRASRERSRRARGAPDTLVLKILYSDVVRSLSKEQRADGHAGWSRHRARRRAGCRSASAAVRVAPHLRPAARGTPRAPRAPCPAAGATWQAPLAVLGAP